MPNIIFFNFNIKKTYKPNSHKNCHHNGSVHDRVRHGHTVDGSHASIKQLKCQLVAIIYTKGPNGEGEERRLMGVMIQ